jgi:hypothetical protein
MDSLENCLGQHNGRPLALHATYLAATEFQFNSLNQRGALMSPAIKMEARRQVCLRCVRLHVDTPSFLELQVVCCHHLPLSTSPGTHLHHFAEQLPPPSLGSESAAALRGLLFSSKSFFRISIQSKQHSAGSFALSGQRGCFISNLFNQSEGWEPAAAYSAPLSVGHRPS